MQGLPASTPPSPAARAFFEAAQTTVQNLYDRWQDECKYENIADYAKPFAELAKTHGIEIVTMHSKPFGMTFKVDSRTYRLKCNSRQCSYQRIG